jgi:hypothetical protein
VHRVPAFLAVKGHHGVAGSAFGGALSSFFSSFGRKLLSDAPASISVVIDGEVIVAQEVSSARPRHHRLEELLCHLVRDEPFQR